MDMVGIGKGLVYIVLAFIAWYLSYNAYTTGVFKGIGFTYRATQPFGFWLGVVTNAVLGFFLLAIAAEQFNLL